MTTGVIKTAVSDGRLSASAPAPGQVVVVAPDVVDSIGHVLGNLFQRLYHLVDLSRTNGAAVGDELEAATRRLEGFLHTALDYLCPSAPMYQDVPLETVVEGLEHRIREVSGAGVVTEPITSGGVLRVDPGALRRSFGLLAARLSGSSVEHQPVRIGAAFGPGEPAAAVHAVLPPGVVAPASSEREVEWALAEKLIEGQGGALREVSGNGGETTWKIVLPFQS